MSVNNQMLERFKEYVHSGQFNAIKIGLASAEKIRSLSYGEIKRIETINYRTLKPEKDGLFCARIFGPQKDWECNCGKYKRMKHRGVTCEKCGVEVIQARVRRERMAHIELVAPVVHIWYLKGIPSYLSIMLDMPVKDIERVVYFDASMVMNPGLSAFKRKQVLSAIECDSYVDAHPEDAQFKVAIGAEAIREILSSIDLKHEIAVLESDYAHATSVALKHKIMRRLKIFIELLQSGLRPEWVVLNVLPVLPPDLRPLVPLEGGRFASSDLNELYRRLLNRNIRLQRLIEIDAPSVIIKNEKRMLQESVDALIDNGRRGQAVRGSNKRPLKSLSEMLRGKQGRFRQNLLGKRVDYSGRSVIVVDPELKLDQCGVPKIMALELFKPYVLAELIVRELAANMRVAKRMVADADAEIWGVLEDVVKKHPVLLNRAPTLHRLGIQAFYPILVDGKAIKIHPLVCSAYNADFDGDQMAVHVPLSRQARSEAANLMLSTENILSPANGRPVTVPSQDMVLGLHYISKVRCGMRGEGTVFGSVAEAVTAYQCGSIDLHARVSLRLLDGRIVQTSVGRILLYEALPAGADFDWINKVLKKSDLAKLVERVYYQFGAQATVICLDRIKHLGFKHSTIAGISFGITDLVIPAKKAPIVGRAEKDVAHVEQLYQDGVITNGERYNKVIGIWGQATADIAKEMYKELEVQDKQAFANKTDTIAPFNPIFMFLESGAKGSRDQIKQLVGMRGLMARQSGDIMETPVRNNFKDGLTVFEYFISTHGARKGQADTALKTAHSGYLTRRLVDVAQDVVISMNDCKTEAFITINDLRVGGDIVYPVGQRAYGRVLAADVRDMVTGELLFSRGHVISREDVEKLSNAAVSKIIVRSALVCQAKRGVCAHCFGMDLASGSLTDLGTTVGIIAAQSIGEPGTQLTMRTFHIGGTASMSEQPTLISKHEGIISVADMRLLTNREGQQILINRRAKIAVMSSDGRTLQEYFPEYGSIIHVTDGQKVSPGTVLAEWDHNNRIILSEQPGIVQYVDLIDNITIHEKFDEATGRFNRQVLDAKSDRRQPMITIADADGNEVAQYYLPTGAYVVVDEGQKVAAGDILVKIPREASKTKDITGGLPRIAELFEARVAKDAALIADIDGHVVFGGLIRGLRKISVVNGDTVFDYLVPRGKQTIVNNGDFVKAGDQLTTGSPVLHDILRIQGPEILQRYLVDQIQEIYRSQGIDINDRHIELIVRQMLRKVRIVEQGDTSFLVGDRVDRVHFRSVNEALVAEGKRPATAKPVLMGITTASLGTESFISAASFQETTRVLVEAAMSGKVDRLYGLKENVIIGKLIPAGTGIASFRERYLKEEGDASQNSQEIPVIEALGQMGVAGA